MNLYLVLHLNIYVNQKDLSKSELVESDTILVESVVAKMIQDCAFDITLCGIGS